MVSVCQILYLLHKILGVWTEYFLKLAPSGVGFFPTPHRGNLKWVENDEHKIQSGKSKCLISSLIEDV